MSRMDHRESEDEWYSAGEAEDVMSDGRGSSWSPDEESDLFRASMDTREIRVEISAFEVCQGEDSYQYAVFVIDVTTGVKKWQTRRRYRQFHKLHKEIKNAVEENPDYRLALGTRGLPSLPPKSLMRSSADDRLARERREKLQEYLQKLLQLSFIWEITAFVSFLDESTGILAMLCELKQLRIWRRALQDDDERKIAKEDMYVLDSELAGADVALLQGVSTSVTQSTARRASEPPSPPPLRASTGSSKMPRQLWSTSLKPHRQQPTPAPVMHAREVVNQAKRSLSDTMYRRTRSVSVVTPKWDATLSPIASPSLNKSTAAESLKKELEGLSLENLESQSHTASPLPSKLDDHLSDISDIESMSLSSSEGKSAGSLDLYSFGSSSSRFMPALIEAAASNHGVDPPLEPLLPPSRPSVEDLKTFEELLRNSTEEDAGGNGNRTESNSSESPETPSLLQAQGNTVSSSVPKPEALSEEGLRRLSDLRLSRCDPKSKKWKRDLFSAFDDLIGWLQPTKDAIEKRQAVLDWVSYIMWKQLGAQIVPIGSFAHRMFLPDGDLDVTACLIITQEDSWFVKVNEALCLASIHPHMFSSQAILARQEELLSASPSKRPPPFPFAIRNFSFINAEVKIIKAVVNNISVDVSANQAEAIVSVALFEEVDEFFGRNHLFKRSVLLAKAWALYETPAITNGRGELLNGTKGRLTTIALNIMMLSIFNQFPERIEHPFQALALLFRAMADFDWDSEVLTIYGPVPADTARNPSISATEIAAQNVSKSAFPVERCRALGMRVKKMEDNMAKRRDQLGSAPPAMVEYAFRFSTMNVVDPLDSTRNLARSVDPDGLFLLRYCLGKALETLTAHTSQLNNPEATESPVTAAQVCRTMFARSWETYGRGDGWRPDILRSMRDPLPHGDGDDESQAEMVDSLACDSTATEAGIQHAEFILGSEISSSALVALTRTILEEHGPVPVGEIGKMLQELTSNANLPAVLKEMYGGLKKFLEAYSNQFIIGDDHPFNPKVRLAGEPFPSHPPIDIPTSRRPGSSGKSKKSNKKRSQAAAASPRS